MPSLGLLLIGMLVLVELYYWFWWLPKNWKRVPDASNFVFAMKTIYGQSNETQLHRSLNARYKIKIESWKSKSH